MKSSNKPNTIYMTYDGLTDPLGQSQVLPYILGLSEKYKITVISFEKDRFKSDLETIRAKISDFDVLWIPLRYTSNPLVLSTLYDIYKLNHTCRALIKKQKIDLIHCRSYITSLVGLSLKKKNKIPFIFDMRGFWADERIEGRIWSNENPVFKMIYRYFKKKEMEFLNRSDYIISLTEAGRNIIQNQLVPNLSTQIEVIPCCVDTEHFTVKNEQKEISERTKNKLKIDKDAFVLGYVGSIGTWYMLPEMLDFFKVLLDQVSDAKFLFVTREDPNEIYRMARMIDLPKECLVIVSSNRSEIPDYIATFDWSIFFIKPVFSKQASSPTKQGELMSMGIPTVYNTGIGDTDVIMKKYDAGIPVATFNDLGYSVAVSQMNNFNTNPNKIKMGSDVEFSLSRGISKYSMVYEKILSKRYS